MINFLYNNASDRCREQNHNKRDTDTSIQEKCVTQNVFMSLPSYSLRGNICNGGD